MHPLVKIVCVFVISICIGLASWANILLTAVIILPFYFFKIDYFFSAWRMIKRLKWFYLSILLVYLFFTPEYNSADSNYINLAGLNAGGYRLSILVFIILAVNLLLRTSSKEQLISGLYLLFLPFKWLGINANTFLIRAYLTLEYIQVLDQQLSTQKKDFAAKFSLKKRVSQLAVFISDWIEQSSQSQQQENKPLSIVLVKYPPLAEWFSPVLLVLLYFHFPTLLDQML